MTAFPPDPAWTLSPPDWHLHEAGLHPATEPDIESRFTTANGLLAMRGARDLGRASAWTSWITTFRPVSWPRCYVAGLFDRPDIEPPVPVAMPAPDWLRLTLRIDGTPLRLRPGADVTRTLDLRRAVMVTTWRHTTPQGATLHLRSLRLAARHDPALALQLVQLSIDRDGAEIELEAAIDPAATGLALTRLDPGHSLWRTEHTAHTLALATEAGLVRAGTPEPPAAHTPLGLSWRWTSRAGEQVDFHRLVAAARGDHPSHSAAPAARAAAAHASERGWRAVLDSHESAWAQRWRASGVTIEGDPAATHALRVATYHLVSAANPADPHVSIGARAQTGDSYLGHVFWDTEIYLLPFYSLTWPEAARALLLYRHRTLPAARARAAAQGFRGAMFAWESADTGAEATPPSILGADGTPVAVHTGPREQHITADIAYAVWNHVLATGDLAFLAEAGAELLVECARFWASRAEPGPDRRLHITGIIGPDEYHEQIDDNAFTNAMAAHAMRCAAEALALLQSRDPDAHAALRTRLALDPAEPRAWREAADALVIAHDPETHLVEQFRGFFALPRVDLRGTTGGEAAALVRGRVQRTQVTKQADTVALFALLPDLFDAETVRASFAYYESQCTHESSLSAAHHAVVAARLGHAEMALRFLQQAAAPDLTGNTAGGIHIAAQGGVWQAAILGFAGLTWQSGTLRLAPRLPPSWQAMEFSLHWQGTRLRIRLTAQSAELHNEHGPATTLHIGPHPVTVPEAGAMTVALD